MISYAIVPSLFSGFRYVKKYTIELPLGLYILTHLIRTLKGSEIPNFIVSILFSPQISKKLCEMMEYKPP